MERSHATAIAGLEFVTAAEYGSLPCVSRGGWGGLTVFLGDCPAEKEVKMNKSEEQEMLDEIALIQGRSIRKGKVDLLPNKATGKYKLKFHAVALDHIPAVLWALENARHQLGT